MLKYLRSDFGFRSKKSICEIYRQNDCSVVQTLCTFLGANFFIYILYFEKYFYIIDQLAIYLRSYVVFDHWIIMKKTSISKNRHKETVELSNKYAIKFHEIKKMTVSSSKQIHKGIVYCPHCKKYWIQCKKLTWMLNWKWYH